MRINSHAHVFNLKNALTREAVKVFLSRLKSQKLPSYLVGPLHAFLRGLLEDGIDPEMTESKALALILKKVAEHKDFKSLAGKEISRGLAKQLEKFIPVAESGQSLEILKGVFAIVVKANSPDAEKDAQEKTVLDFIEFLRINFLPTIDAVTDELIAQSGPEDIFVALPMDIVDEEASKRDLAVYPKQFEETVAQALRYPGRILPFAKMNPRRGKTALELFDSFSKAGKCVGLKLYPSLGYAVDTPEMRKAYKICGNRSLPVLLHCNEGGFRRSVADAKKCDPNAWKAILTDFPKLKVCFGHFGGDQYFVESSIDPGSWAGSILALMRDHPDQVYADIAYHTECMANTTVKQRYQRNLKALLKDPVYGRLILWGSDFFLVRQQLTDRSYIAFYEKLFTTKEFEKLSVANPKRFLGLGDETGANIRRHVNYLNKRKDKISSESSAAWLREFAVEEGLDLASVLAPGNWERNNRAHGALAYFLWARKVQNDAGIPSYIPESLRKQLKTAHPGKDDLFHAIGDLRMGQLSYFLDNPGTGNQLKVAIRVFVTDLQKILLGANWFKAKPAASNLTKTAIFNKLVAVAEKKGATVKNLGNVINKVYRFPQ